MALATRCPHCKTTFRVASDQLKLRGGIVRCGTCNQVFDGNASLVDLDAIEHQAPPPPAADWIPEPAPAPEPQALDESPLEFTVEPEPEPAPEPEPEPAPCASDAFDQQIAAIEAAAPIVLEPGYVLDFDLSEPELVPESEPGYQPDIDLDGEAGPATQFGTDPEFDSLNDPRFGPPLPDDGELSLADDIGATFSSDQGPEPAPPALESGPLPLLRASADEMPIVFAPPVVAPASAEEAELDEPEFVRLGREKEQAARRRRLVMGSGSVLLALLLLGQGITTFRNVLAATYPGLKPALSAGCALLRCKIELPAQIETLVIETGELQSIANGTFQLTTLLRNESSLTQAWPYIELELTDTSDKPLVRRVFTPPQYLPQGVEPAKGFGAHSEQAVKIHFELKQLKASGYHIAVFYP